MNRIAAALVALFVAAPAALAQPTEAQFLQNAAQAQTVLNGPRLVGPAPTSAVAQAADDALADATYTPERIAQATADRAVDAFAAFQPVLGESFSARTFPRTARVLMLAIGATGPVISQAKVAYPRPRPFVANPTRARCNPDPTGGLDPNASYPSGHAAIGYAWALTLAELVPSRAQAILERGIAYSESRVVCGVHNESDVAAGRLIASAVIARMHGDRAFRAALDDARSELVPLAAN